MVKKEPKALIEHTAKLLEGFTGIAISSKKELIRSGVHIIIKSLRSREFLRVFLNEWNKYKEKGVVKEDYLRIEQGKTCLQELLSFLENDMPDERRFNALKNIFLVAATEKITNRKSPLPLMYIQICRTLTSGEVLVLETAYRLLKHKESLPKHDLWSADNWLDIVAKESGLAYRELVEKYEEGLIVKHLITGRKHNDKSGVDMRNFRLTSLGLEICKYIENYIE